MRVWRLIGSDHRRATAAADRFTAIPQPPIEGHHSSESACTELLGSLQVVVVRGAAVEKAACRLRRGHMSCVPDVIRVGLLPPLNSCASLRRGSLPRPKKCLLAIVLLSPDVERARSREVTRGHARSRAGQACGAA